MLVDSVVDFVLRCTDGPYKGNFVYINLTQEGETIGSDPLNSLVILDPNLDPFHA